MMKLILISLALSLSFFSRQDIASKSFAATMQMENSNTRLQAYKILQNKCNSCHRIKNKNRVFTLENMDGYGKKIYRQVFIWKRMPKRSAPGLTTQEKKHLREWLASITIK